MGIVLLGLQFSVYYLFVFSSCFLTSTVLLDLQFLIFPLVYLQPSAWQINCVYISHWSNNKNGLALKYAANRYQAIKSTQNTLKSRLLCFGCIIHNVRSIIGPCKPHLDFVVVHVKVSNTIRKLFS